MSGNVSEWTESALGDDRIYRNSGWRGKAQFYRVSYWTYDYPSRRHRDLGFRLALDP
jgi:formylglycine-generating enzyme required for sulfatase activity